MATTTNYGWILPTVDSDVNTWGGLLNDIFNTDTTVDSIDTVVADLRTDVDAAMPLLGGTFAGDVFFGTDARLTESEEVRTGDAAIDWAQGNFFTITLAAGANTFSFSNLPTNGRVQFITLNIRQPSGGNGTITWPSTVGVDKVYWQDDTAPVLSTIGYDWDVVTLFCYNGDVVIGAHALTALDAPTS